MGNESIGKFAIVQKLGKGRFGKTRLCSTIDNYPIAVKIYEIAGHNIKEVIRQMNKLCKAQIKGVVKMKDTIVIDQQKFGLVMEYYDRSSLSKELQQRSLLEIVEIMKAIAINVQNLHQKYQIAHKNLKPQNIFIVDNEAFLSDINFSCSQHLKLRQTLGCLDYQAKQTYEDINNFASDIWSLGVIFIELLTGQRIRNLQFLGEILRPSMQRNEYPSTTTLQMIQNVDLNYLIKKMVGSNPLKRINISQVLKLINDFLNNTGKAPELSPTNKKNSLIAKKGQTRQFLFRFDSNHPCINHFHFAGNKIRRADNQPKRYQAVSKESIPAGRWFVNIKINHYGENNDEVVVGVLSEERRKQKMSGDIDQYNSISLWTSLANLQSNLCENGVWNSIPLPLVNEKTGLLKIIVDTEERRISWFIDGAKVAVSKMPESYWNQEHFVFVALKGVNCQLQFGEKDLMFI